MKYEQNENTFSLKCLVEPIRAELIQTVHETEPASLYTTMHTHFLITVCISQLI